MNKRSITFGIYIVAVGAVSFCTMNKYSVAPLGYAKENFIPFFFAVLLSILAFFMRPSVVALSVISLLDAALCIAFTDNFYFYASLPILIFLHSCSIQTDKKSDIVFSVGTVVIGFSAIPWWIGIWDRQQKSAYFSPQYYNNITFVAKVALVLLFFFFIFLFAESFNVTKAKKVSKHKKQHAASSGTPQKAYGEKYNTFYLLCVIFSAGMLLYLLPYAENEKTLCLFYLWGILFAAIIIQKDPTIQNTCFRRN